MAIHPRKHSKKTATKAVDKSSKILKGSKDLKSSRDSKDMREQLKGHKVNNYLIAAVGIVAIVVIVYLAVLGSSYTPASSSINQNSNDAAGQASLVAAPVRACRFIAAPTTIYDSQSLSVSLEKGASTYYSGNTVTVEDITDYGCIINVGGERDFLAVGQLQKLGPMYITVKEVLRQ